MQLISELKISDNKSLQLFKGDLTQIPYDQKVDFLVLSAFPDNYLPTTTSLIGALYRKGLSVEKLAQEKELDLRAYSHCWISKEISYPNIKRILCFEPKPDPFANPYSQIAEIFQSLTLISKSHSIKSIGLPLLMTGEQNYSVDKVIDELVNTSLLWLEKQPFETIKIVELSDKKVMLLKKAIEKKAELFKKDMNDNNYDFFVSYSRKNEKEIEIIRKELGNKFKLFIDTQEIGIGTNWLDKINKAMAGSKRFIVCLSDTYIQSKVCKYEYSFCNLKYIQEGDEAVLPLYLYSADLPFEMSILNFYNAREGNTKKINDFCRLILQKYS
ncbi:toll/interleukin-1 receptor domain-containing protein [Aquimarina gracilis]|uniref:Toll/interleukin-1 receptor domain-containing protein n=1 Tax=Aquimarina gracilis TaxID=874422 RepID=A0ABU5ZWC0_9FLAO|nr:toll/interleukin-1 receptor domain-containing protein [Aquimarina gracilis]MEB3346180.1 toll/interleukin-1 receptor domain-containing protein [Aquimarina gracilis]